MAVVGRRGKQRLWDLAERWYPESEKISWPEAKAIFEDRRFRARGVSDVSEFHVVSEDVRFMLPKPIRQTAPAAAG